MGLRMIAMEERIIMVPPLSSEVAISKSKVSSSYLEQMTMVFLNSLLDLSTCDILHKRDMILKYTSGSNPDFSRKINEYFADSADKYKKFDLVTYFTVKNMEVDESKNEVIAHGILTSRYGKRGFEANPASYRLTYEFSGGYLRLKEFQSVSEEKEKLKSNNEGDSQ
jgi:type IV conjugative transfer system protein TraE